MPIVEDPTVTVKCKKCVFFTLIFVLSVI